MIGTEHPDRLYPLLSEGGLPFITGLTERGEQVLVGSHLLGLVALLFDNAGVLLRAENRESSDLPSAYQASLDTTMQQARRQVLKAALDTYKSEIGYHPATIKVQRFNLPELNIGIFDYPQMLTDYIADRRHKRFEMMQEELQEWLERWQSEGQFVLRWRDEFWMNADGEVTDT